MIKKPTFNVGPVSSFVVFLHTLKNHFLNRTCITQTFSRTIQSPYTHTFDYK